MQHRVTGYAKVSLRRRAVRGWFWTTNTASEEQKSVGWCTAVHTGATLGCNTTIFYKPDHVEDTLVSWREIGCRQILGS